MKTDVDFDDVDFDDDDDNDEGLFRLKYYVIQVCFCVLLNHYRLAPIAEEAVFALCLDVSIISNKSYANFHKIVEMDRHVTMYSG